MTVSEEQNKASAGLHTFAFLLGVSRWSVEGYGAEDKVKVKEVSGERGNRKPEAP